MCAESSKSTYTRRIANNECVRCGAQNDSSLRKCSKCRGLESIWRKNTRDRRRDQEKRYKQSIYDQRICCHSKDSDTKMNRPVIEHSYITPRRIRMLRRLQRNKCLYCSQTLQVLNRRQPDGLTVERLRNYLPHNSDNVILCCHQCNVRRIGNKKNIGKTNLQIFYDIWCQYKESGIPTGEQKVNTLQREPLRFQPDVIV